LFIPTEGHNRRALWLIPLVMTLPQTRTFTFSLPLARTLTMLSLDSFRFLLLNPFRFLVSSG
jgi:hypothetical protein